MGAVTRVLRYVFLHTLSEEHTMGKEIAMIYVMIVDDDKIVRKGLVNLLPWDRHHMKVAAEAANGQKALQILKDLDYKIDLVITDITMPLMNGIELICQIKKSYPHILCAVLTLHEDFKYVQEAIRLGVIDFIQKSEIEENSFDDLLERLSAQIKERGYEGGKKALEENQGISRIWSVFPLDSLEIPAGIKGLPLRPSKDGSYFYCAEESSFVSEFSSFCRNEKNFHTVIWSDAGGIPSKRIEGILSDYARCGVFYEYGNSSGPIVKSFKNDSAAPEDSASSKKFCAKLLSFEWIISEADLDTCLEGLYHSRTSPQKLLSLADEIFQIAQYNYHSVLRPEILSWKDFVKWIKDLRQEIVRLIHVKYYSEEICRSIQKALCIIQKEIATPLFAADIAERINLSRSYFNLCFKDIMGVPFNDYIRAQRIARACYLLRTTSDYIPWIAAQSGYQDDKYFSRIFKRVTGVLPSAYRKRFQR